MNILDLMIGKKMIVKTDMKVDVELEIKKVTEDINTITRDLEPSTQANDWWPAQESTTTVKYIVEFTNGATKIYGSLKEIKLI